MLAFIIAFSLAFAAALIFYFVRSLPRLACWTYAFRKQERLINEKKNRIAILIPARDESKSVGRLFEDIVAQDYPRELFDVHVIVADPDDATVKMAKECGFFSLAVTDQTCKSDALDACMRKILAEDESKYDAYLIIDADCGLAPDFLTEMNNALSTGADVVCSKKVVKNYFYGTLKECTMSACCNGLIWTMLDNLGNRYKSAKGYPCFTVGTGLMLTADVIKKKGGWPYKKTLTEDIELMYEAALDHRKFFYYEHAVLYMEEAQKLSVTNKRRRRWLTGVVQSERLYRKAVKKGCTRGENYYTRGLKPIFGLMGVPAVYCGVMAIMAVVLGVMREPLWGLCLTLSISTLALIYMSLLGFTVLAMLSDRNNIRLPIRRKIALAAVHPLFYMQYIYIVGKPLIFPTKAGGTWEVIERVDFNEEK